MANLIPFSPSRLDATIFLEKKLKILAKNRQNILDIGCGKLYFYHLLSRIGIKGTYLGVDLNPLEFRNQGKTLNGKTTKVDFLKYKSKKKFSLIACLWVLEHIKNEDLAVRKIPKMLKKSGILIIAVPSIWSWPIEFGRHGYRYYWKKNILKTSKKAGFNLIQLYEASGLFGLLFMFVYSWPRFLLLIFLFMIFSVSKTLGLTRNSWKNFSRELIGKSFYRYHRSVRGIKIHNFIVDKIVRLDNKFKIFPASYILILKKK